MGPYCESATKPKNYGWATRVPRRSESIKSTTEVRGCVQGVCGKRLASKRSLKKVCLDRVQESTYMVVLGKTRYAGTGGFGRGARPGAQQWGWRIVRKGWTEGMHVRGGCVRLFQDKAPGTNAQKKSRPTKGRMVDTRPYLLVGQEGTWKASKHVHRASPISHGCDAHIS